jgi:hypothetical protein
LSIEEEAKLQASSSLALAANIDPPPSSIVSFPHCEKPAQYRSLLMKPTFGKPMLQREQIDAQPKGKRVFEEGGAIAQK